MTNLCAIKAGALGLSVRLRSGVVGELRARRFAGFKFSRQHHIGLYFADFCCVTRHRIIQLKRNQHAEPEQECTDLLRTAGLTEQGYRVMRFWNTEVNTEIEDVLEAIYAALPVSLIARPWRPR